MTTRLHEFDDLGMLRNVDLHEDGVSILEDNIYYKANPSSSLYTTKHVSKESFKLLGEGLSTRRYTTDVVGNVTSIDDHPFASHNYEYDYRGFLVKEDSNVFEYDKNGNITRNGNRVYQYDSVIKDRLKYVDGNEITYYSNNPGCPQSYNGNTYYYEGRRLVGIDTNDNQAIRYEYDDKGLRIKKTIEDLADGTLETIDYIYEEGKLVTELREGYRLDFLYDENKELYGFIYNNKKYYYVRDVLKNILGIVTKEEGLVVQYDYTAYGELKSINGTLASTIGVINPFRYKGYYYDKETNMFYCKSRYYNPLWCRFINIDSVGCLDTENINGMNLYCYCMNNPVMLVDENGDLPKWAKNLITGVAVVAAVVTVSTLAICSVGSVAPIIVGAAVGAVSSCGMSIVSQSAFEGEVDWKQVIVDASIGAVLGAFGGSAIGVKGAKIAGGLTEGIGSMVNDLVSGNDINFLKAGMSAIGGVFMSSSGSQHGRIGSYTNAKTALKGLTKNSKEYNKALKHLKKVTRRLDYNAISDNLKELPYNLVIDYIFMGV